METRLTYISGNVSVIYRNIFVVQCQENISKGYKTVVKLPTGEGIAF